MRYVDYTQSLHDYMYSEWILNGVSVLFLAMLAFGGLYLTGKNVRRKYTLWRTSKMTPERYREWQSQMFAKDLVDMADNLVSRGIYSRSEMNQLLESIGHRNQIWDLVPKERVERGPAAVLKALIRRRTEELKKEKQTLGQKLGEELKRTNGRK
jgi:hypothetical protein